MTVKLSSAQRRYLKQLAHHLKPLLQLGKEGPSPKFVREVVTQLDSHELLKMRVLNNCMAPASDIVAALEEQDVTVVQKVGHVYTLFLQREQDSEISLPDPK